MSLSVFDIESQADRTRALELMPAFSPEDVKCGNLGPEKAAAKIEEARISHQDDWLDKAALRPETANILAIGVYANERGLELLSQKNCGDEKALLTEWWDRFNKHYKETGRPMGGWFVYGFDYPMIILRSRILGVPVPGGLRKGRYFDSQRTVDLLDDYLMGRIRTEVKCSLDYVASIFGLGSKNGDGKNFGALYASDYTAAMQYLAKDVFLTKAIAEKLGYDMRPETETWEAFKARFLDGAAPEKPVSQPTEKPEF